MRNHLKKCKTDDQPSDEQENDPELKQNELFIPNLIVRTLEGEKSAVFFVGWVSRVLVFEHTPKQLVCFTDENSTILWEPGRGTSAVYFPGVNARIIATVSPDENLFHEFKIDAKMFYMPPPSELQLRLMGQIYRRFLQQGCTTVPLMKKFVTM